MAVLKSTQTRCVFVEITYHIHYTCIPTLAFLNIANLAIMHLLINMSPLLLGTCMHVGESMDCYAVLIVRLLVLPIITTCDVITLASH